MGAGSSCCKGVDVVEPHAGGSVHAAIQTRTGSGFFGKLSANNSQAAAEPESSASAVKVAVVVRPLMEFEQQAGSSSIVQVMPPNKVLVAKATGDGTQEFAYDKAYQADTAAAHSALYNELVSRVLQRFCQGFNGTILAYGQTGSGKTYTMGTSANSSHNQAVIPTVVTKVFKHAADSRAKYDVSLKVSFVEVYNEVVQDLLVAPSPLAPSKSSANLPAAAAAAAAAGAAQANPGGGAGSWSAGMNSGDGGVQLREGPKGEIILDGVTEVTVTSPKEVTALLATGNKNRATAAHKLNQESSRSHAIVMLTMTQRVRPAAAASVPQAEHVLRGKLHLVDLAGSERSKETGTTGQRFTEGVYINKGLLELGNVINALTEGSTRRHIPYRNSKLTRLLQDSLGGNSETLFIACVSPAESNTDHTISTLRYASRAMRITNALVQNRMTPEEEVLVLRALVQQLQTENATLKQQMAGQQAIL